MNGNALKIDTGEVNVSGTGINTGGTNFQTEVASFKIHSQQILNIWTGDDATTFGELATEVGDLLDRASVTVQEVGTHLVDTATGVEDAVAENKSSMSAV